MEAQLISHPQNPKQHQPELILIQLDKIRKKNYLTGSTIKSLETGTFFSQAGSHFELSSLVFESKDMKEEARAG